MDKQELKKAFEEKLITEEQYKQELFKIETSPKKERKAKRIYDAVKEEDFLKLLDATKKKHHKIIFLLAYGSGLRIEEITQLTPSDINLKEHTIKIVQGKGSKDRITYLSKNFREEYLKYLPIKIGIRAIEQVFTRKSLKLGFNKLLYTFKKKGKDCPKYQYSFHSLRHSFAKNCLDQNVPVHQVQLLMGHENLATTSKYTKANPKDAIQSLMDKGF